MPQNPLVISGQELASNTDIFNGTRFATIPYNGILTFKMSVDVWVSGTTSYAITISLPGDSVPIESTEVPANGTGGVLDDRLALIVSYYVSQGGKVLFSGVEVGTCIFSWMARLKEG